MNPLPSHPRPPEVNPGSLAAWSATLASLLTCGVAPHLHAEGYRGPTAGASDLGVTGGRIAFVDDASAVFHNPANLLDLPRWEASAEPTFVHHSVRFQSANTGAVAETRDPWKLLPHLYLGGPVKEGRLAVGLGISTPWGLSIDWGDGGGPTALKYSAPSFTELKSINFNPSAAIRLAEGLHLGVGLDVMWSELTLEQFLPGAAITGNPASPDGFVQARGDGIGVSGNAALTWQVARRHRLALTVRPEMNIDYDGDIRLSQPPGTGLFRGPFGSEMPFPTIVALGYGFQATDRLRLATDFEWLNFSRFKALPLQGAPAIGLPAQLPENWEDSFTLGAAASYDLGDGWRIRASYQYFDSPSIDATFSPAIPDANQHAVAAGVGYRHGRHRLDLGYSRVFYEERVISTYAGLQSPLNGRYETGAHLVSVAYGLSF